MCVCLLDSLGSFTQRHLLTVHTFSCHRKTFVLSLPTSFPSYITKLATILLATYPAQRRTGPELRKPLLFPSHPQARKPQITCILTAGQGRGEARGVTLTQPSENEELDHIHTLVNMERDSNRGSNIDAAADRASLGSKAVTWRVLDENHQAVADGADQKGSRQEKYNGPQTRLPIEKTPLMRLKKKLRRPNPEIANGLIAQAAKPRLRISSLNAKPQTSLSDSNQQPGELYTVPVSQALIVLAAYTAFLFVSHPSRTLQLILTSLMFFASFPDWMPWWTALLCLVLPMGLKARLEVTMWICMLVWLRSLQWAPARRRVGRWVWEG